MTQSNSKIKLPVHKPRADAPEPWYDTLLELWRDLEVISEGRPAERQMYDRLSDALFEYETAKGWLGDLEEKT